MKKIINTLDVQGRIFQHDLQEKVSGPTSKHPGTKFISGSIDVATDESEVPNIVTVHYTYVAETYGSGAPNRTYGVLSRIINEGKTVVADGDAAWCVRLQPSIALNDFYPQGQTEVVSRPRNEGGFATIINPTQYSAERNKFTVDLLINGVSRVDAEDGSVVAHIHGATFDFRNSILPMTFVVRSEEAASYFESLEPSQNNPIFTNVWGQIVSRNETIKTETLSAFGAPQVDERPRRVREYLITGAKPDLYEFGDSETGITADEIKKAIEDRNLYLADTKRRSDEYRANRAAAAPVAPVVTVQQGAFNF